MEKLHIGNTLFPYTTLFRPEERRVGKECTSECYMSDVPRPFKQTLPEYNRLEDQLLDMIYMHFLGSTLDNAEQEILKDIDNAMLWYDLTYLLHEKQPIPKPQVYDEPDYTVRPFTDVEEEYLQIYQTFIQKLH